MTKFWGGLIVTMGSLLQIPDVTRPLLKAVEHHPHIASLLAACITLASLAHNPLVIRALHQDSPNTAQTPSFNKSEQTQEEATK